MDPNPCADCHTSDPDCSPGDCEVANNKKKRRDICDVIDKIIDVIPKRIGQPSSFILELIKVKDRTKYAAPETIGLLWNDLGQVFNIHVPYPAKEDWQKKAVNIFLGGSNVDNDQAAK